MPISQKTVLAIYGELCDLADMAEKLRNLAAQGDLFTAPRVRRLEVEADMRKLLLRVDTAQRNALAAILHDEPDTEVNPLTGRLL